MPKIKQQIDRFDEALTERLDDANTSSLGVRAPFVRSCVQLSFSWKNLSGVSNYLQRFITSLIKLRVYFMSQVVTISKLKLAKSDSFYCERSGN